MNATNPTNPTATTTAAPTNAFPPVTTPGYKTSEFWMTLLGHAGLVAAAASGVLPARYAAIAAAVSQVAYNLSRGLTKAGAANAIANAGGLD